MMEWHLDSEIVSGLGSWVLLGRVEGLGSGVEPDLTQGVSSMILNNLWGKINQPTKTNP